MADFDCSVGFGNEDGAFFCAGKHVDGRSICVAHDLYFWEFDHSRQFRSRLPHRRELKGRRFRNLRRRSLTLKAQTPRKLSGCRPSFVRGVAMKSEGVALSLQAEP